MNPQQVRVGANKTTRLDHPEMYEEMERGPSEFGPTSDGDGAQLIGEVRASYAKAQSPIGHMPEVGSSEETVVELFDKLGERLAFERAGVRLYDAILSKHDAFGSFDGGPSREDLEHIRREEQEHFLMLHQAISELGADPSAVTPSADLAATVSRGVQDALTDPRVNLLQSLEAILVAELADHASWEMLVTLAERGGQTKLVKPFQRAHQSEEEHVEKVRGWILAGHELRS